MRRLAALVVLVVTTSTIVVGGGTASAMALENCGETFVDYSNGKSAKASARICINSTEDGATGGGDLHVECYDRGLLGIWTKRYCTADGTFEIRKGDANGQLIHHGEFHGNGFGEIYLYQQFHFRCQGPGSYHLGIKETRVDLYDVYSGGIIAPQPFAGMYLRNDNGASINITYCPA